jgi:hypothetical protein
MIVKPLIAVLGGAVCVAVWIVLAFVVAIPSGWVHILLAIGVVLFSVAIIESAPANGDGRAARGEKSSHP